jgi:hypothetical protein
LVAADIARDLKPCADADCAVLLSTLRWMRWAAAGVMGLLLLPGAAVLFLLTDFLHVFAGWQSHHRQTPSWADSKKWKFEPDRHFVKHPAWYVASAVCRTV